MSGQIITGRRSLPPPATRYATSPSRRPVSTMRGAYPALRPTTYADRARVAAMSARDPVHDAAPFITAAAVTDRGVTDRGVIDRNATDRHVSDTHVVERHVAIAVANGSGTNGSGTSRTDANGPALTSDTATAGATGTRPGDPLVAAMPVATTGERVSLALMVLALVSFLLLVVALVVPSSVRLALAGAGFVGLVVARVVGALTGWPERARGLGSLSPGTGV